MKNSKTQTAWRASWALASLLVLGGCVTYTMGQASNTLSTLRSEVTSCRSSGSPSQTNGTKDEEKEQDAVGCIGTVASLRTFSMDMAAEAAQPDASDANAAYFYFAAAQAAWLAGDDNVYVYTSNGRQKCGDDPAKKEIPPETCQMFDLIDVFATVDLKTKAFNVAHDGMLRPARETSYLEKDTDTGRTKIETMAAYIETQGMAGLVEENARICGKLIHDSMTTAMRKQYTLLRNSLDRLAKKAAVAMEYVPPDNLKPLCSGTAVNSTAPAVTSMTDKQRVVVGLHCLAANSVTADAAIACK